MASYYYINGEGGTRFNFSVLSPQITNDGHTYHASFPPNNPDFADNGRITSQNPFQNVGTVVSTFPSISSWSGKTTLLTDISSVTTVNAGISGWGTQPDNTGLSPSSVFFSDGTHALAIAFMANGSANRKRAYIGLFYYSGANTWRKVSQTPILNIRDDNFPTLGDMYTTLTSDYMPVLSGFAITLNSISPSSNYGINGAFAILYEYGDYAWQDDSNISLTSLDFEFQFSYDPTGDADNRFYEYLKAIRKPHRKIAKLEFLNSDGTVAFTLDNKYKRGYNIDHDTRAFIQEGTLNVSLNNGQRRRASIRLANIDGAFDYAVNKLWFGRQVKLSMGVVLPDGSDYYLPQGVFYLNTPSWAHSPTENTISFNLVDKWAALDGTVGGTLEATYSVPAMKSVLPNGYTQYEYLVCNGNQHFDTGINPDNNTIFAFDFEIAQKASMNLFGVSETGKNHSLRLTSTGISQRFGSSEENIVGVSPHLYKANQRTVVSVGKRNVVGNQRVLDPPQNITFTSTSTAMMLNIRSATTGGFVGKFYGAKIYNKTSSPYSPDNGTLLANYIPCKSNGGQIGVYDAVSGSFYAISGAGAPESGEASSGIFDAISSILKISKYDFNATEDKNRQIDNVSPVFTTYYNGKTYNTEDGSSVPMLSIPYDINVGGGSTISALILELNTVIAGLIGYDPNGALRIEPSQDDIDDREKEVIWDFSTDDQMTFDLPETYRNTDMRNDVLIVGQDLSGYEVYGRASNYDPNSPTNINLCGRKLHREENSKYWTSEQCVALAVYMLKRKTNLERQITIQCAPIYHLLENRLVSVRRTDKPGQPVENHLIQSFSLPIGESGAMSINAVSVSDYPEITTSSALHS